MCVVAGCTYPYKVIFPKVRCAKSGTLGLCTCTVSLLHLELYPTTNSSLALI